MGSCESNARTKTGVDRVADLERRVVELRRELEAERTRSAGLEHTVVRRERERLIQALHDTVCQSLSGVGLEVAVLSHKLDAEGSEAAAEGKVLREMIRQAVDEMHELVQTLQGETGNSAMPDLPCAVEIHRELASPSP